MINPPIPGTTILTQIHGWKGEATWFLQAMTGDLSPWNHVGLTTLDSEVFEAHPEGARLVPWIEFRRSEAGGFRPMAEVPISMTDDQRLDLVEMARGLVGTEYNWHIYLYHAAIRLRLPWAAGRLREKVRQSNRVICSHVIAELHRRVGVELFDEREPYEVRPCDFAKLLP